MRAWSRLGEDQRWRADCGDAAQHHGTPDCAGLPAVLERRFSIAGHLVHTALHLFRAVKASRHDGFGEAAGCRSVDVIVGATT
jgi:hypothetical protein